MIEFLMEQAARAHWYTFGLLMLAGLNIPISEDVVMIGSAVLAAAIVPENFFYLLIGAFLGAYLSDLECYWLARIVGPRLLKIKFFSKLINQDRLDLAKRYLDRFGPATLLAGRFIPFGVRNGMFMTCGLSKMVFWKFALYDFIACCMTTTVLFGLGYSFGKNYKILLLYVNQGKIYIFAAFLCGVLTAVLVAWHRKRRANASTAAKEAALDANTARSE